MAQSLFLITEYSLYFKRRNWILSMQNIKFFIAHEWDLTFVDL